MLRGIIFDSNAKMSVVEWIIRSSFAIEVCRTWNIFCTNSRICTRWKCNCCSILLNAYGMISWKRECSFLIRASDEYFRWNFNHTGVRARQDNVSCFSRFVVSRDAIPFFFLSFFLLKKTSIEISREITLL